MARKATVTESMILDNAFLLMRTEGAGQLTARKLAAKAGCSTQPIFRLYENMEQVVGLVYERAILFFEYFCRNYLGKNKLPFIDLGMAYISFAAKERHVFRFLFLSEYRGGRSMYELLNGNTSVVSKEVLKARAAGVSDPSGLFMQMWIFIHGAACMALMDDFDLGEEETLALLKNVYQSYVKAMA